MNVPANVLSSWNYSFSFWFFFSSNFNYFESLISWKPRNAELQNYRLKKTNGKCVRILQHVFWEIQLRKVKILGHIISTVPLTIEEVVQYYVIVLRLMCVLCFLCSSCQIFLLLNVVLFLCGVACVSTYWMIFCPLTLWTFYWTLFSGDHVSYVAQAEQLCYICCLFVSTLWNVG